MIKKGEGTNTHIHTHTPLFDQIDVFFFLPLFSLFFFSGHELIYPP